MKGPMDIDELTQAAYEAATAGAKIATYWQGRGAERNVREKTSPRDLVSRADVETESAIRQALHQLRPDDAIVGEEHPPSSGSSGVTWFVDPIDGTTSYLYGRCGWAVSVAAAGPDGGVLTGVVAEPAHHRVSIAAAGRGAWVKDESLQVSQPDDLVHVLVEAYFGRPGPQRDRAAAMVGALLGNVRDLQRSGSAAVALANVAAGRADAVWSPGLQPWDGAAGLLLVHEAGGLVGDLDGPTERSWPPSGDVLAASPAVWHPLRDLLASVYGREP